MLRQDYFDPYYARRKKMRSRRGFLRQSTVFAGASVLGIGRGKWLAALDSGIDAGSIDRFRSKLNGRLILPGDTDYDTARAVSSQNPETNKRPRMIARCKSEQDVLRCIDFAHEHELEVAVRSGNHSFLGWGTCERGIVIDLSLMKGVTVDPAKRSALVSAGSNAGEIRAAAAPFGLAPVLGECPTVGAGLALGGGLGWLSGMYGATCDNLLSARLITAEARILDAGDSANHDLFWAIRGGGGNFGVATRLQYRLHPVNAVLAGDFIYPVSSARTMFRSFGDFMSNAPDEMQADCHFMTDRGGQFIVQFVYSGNLEKGESLLNQFRKIRQPQHDSVKRRKYAELDAMNSDFEMNWKFRLPKGTYLERVSDEVIDLIVDRFAQRPSTGEAAFNFDHYMHGEVCRIPDDATAFSLRKPGAVQLGFWTEWNSPTDASRCMTWVNETFRLLQPYSAGRIYTNYMCSTGPQAAKSAFGPNFERLVTIKRKYDPDNFFHLNQNLDPRWEH
jgi:FAD binding domain/Berberine and berberine like